MAWHCISPPHFEDVIPWAWSFFERGITTRQEIESRLRKLKWEHESIEAVVHWVAVYQMRASIQ